MGVDAVPPELQTAEERYYLFETVADARNQLPHLLAAEFENHNPLWTSLNVHCRTDLAFFTFFTAEDEKMDVSIFADIPNLLEPLADVHYFRENGVWASDC